MDRRKYISAVMLNSLLMLIICNSFAHANDNTTSVKTIVEVFTDNGIHFSQNEKDKYSTGLIKADDNGRMISRMVELPKFDGPVKITATMAVKPIPKDHLVVHDKWDRAGTFKLIRDGKADVELCKFMTAYGGLIEYEVDVSHLATLLQGSCEIGGWIDTWVSPAWLVDFTLTFEPLGDTSMPVWSEGIMFEESVNLKSLGDSGVIVEVTIPNDLNRVILYYYVSGHCTDGNGADEFEQKDNVIYVDGRSVYRFRPWRDDCRKFRDINPYTRRWSDGWWSSDYSRSGWCPGDMVLPIEIDLSDHLKAGNHTVRFMIENVRPENEKGDHGYWRISSQLAGWK